MSSVAANMTDSFSAPPSAPPPEPAREETGSFNKGWSIPSYKPTAAVSGADHVVDPYEQEDLSKYTSKVYDPPGLAGRLSDAGFNVHPRVKNCLNSIKSGAQLGGAVGGIFGALSGTVMAVQQRNVFVLPIATIGGAASFGFFLGCGMIIRCDELQPSERLLQLHENKNSAVNIRESNCWPTAAKWEQLAPMQWLTTFTFYKWTILSWNGKFFVIQNFDLAITSCRYSVSIVFIFFHHRAPASFPVIKIQ